jgi:hypothetical protein
LRLRGRHTDRRKLRVRLARLRFCRRLRRRGRLCVARRRRSRVGRRLLRFGRRRQAGRRGQACDHRDQARRGEESANRATCRHFVERADRAARMQRSRFLLRQTHFSRAPKTDHTSQVAFVMPQAMCGYRAHYARSTRQPLEFIQTKTILNDRFESF